MSAPSETRIQANFKTGTAQDAALINVYADSEAEMGSLLDALVRLAPAIASARTAVLAVGNIAQGFPGAQVTETRTAPTTPEFHFNGNAAVPGPAPQQPQYAPNPNQPPPPTCQHGARLYKEGVSKAGKNYKGWFCPQNSCQAQWG